METWTCGEGDEDTCGTHFVVSFLVTRRMKGSLGISIGDCGGGEVAMDDMVWCSEVLCRVQGLGVV
jgi:hypothetical protein